MVSMLKDEWFEDVRVVLTKEEVKGMRFMTAVARRFICIECKTQRGNLRRSISENDF